MTVFFDMDGVLCDFVGGACRVHGRPNPYDSGWTEWDLVKPWGMPHYEFWEPLRGENFWALLDPLHDGLDAFYALETRGVDLAICTAASGPGAAAGKLVWIKKHLPRYYRRVVMTVDKSLVAGPGKVLVDDCDENLTKWEGAGGKAVAFPRPWNRARTTATTAVVQNVMEAAAS